MANLISLTANGLNGIAKTPFVIVLPVAQIKQVTAETKNVGSALSSVYVYSSKTGGATIDYQVTINQAAVLAAANA